MSTAVWRFSLGLILALSAVGFLAPSPTAARQDADCTGIEEYIATLEATGEELEETFPASDEDNLDTWTSEQFTAASEAITNVQETFGEIEPPAIAEEFHALLLQQFGLLSDVFATMATTGVFGMLMFAEQLETNETDLDAAAQQIEDACGVELTDVIDDEESAATPVAGTDESATGTTSTGAGTRANPIPLGETARIHPDWELTVVSVTPDATEMILAENTFNEPPADGQQYFLATVRLTYVGATSDQFYVSDLNAVGQSAVGYNQFDDDCGTIPNELPTRELFTGGTIEGNVCWAIASADADSLVLYDNYGPSDERVYLSMMPGQSSGTPAATDR
ncbi:MAG: hypothetical protein R2855_06525 [Thermomicrobiales bacterium]